MAGPGLVFCVAKLFEDAFGAFGTTGLADTAAVMDQLVGEKNPAVLWNHAHQVLLDFLGIGIFCQIEPLGKALNMRVNDDAGSDAIGGAENDVGGLTGNAREFENFVHRSRNFAMELVDQHLAAADDRFCLVAEETGAANILLELRGIGVGEMLRRRIFLEEAGSDLIDAGIGALGRKNGGDKQLESIVVMQRTLGRGIVAIEAGQNLPDAAGVRAPGAVCFWRG